MGYEDLQYGDREDMDGAADIARRLWASFTNPPEKGFAKWRLVGNKEIHSIGITYLEGQGDLVSRLITHISHIITPMIPIINLLIKPP